MKRLLQQLCGAAARRGRKPARKIPRYSSQLCLDQLEAREVPACIAVLNTLDSGEDSLRWAIEKANAMSGHDTICFNIPGAGVHTITPATPLPALTDAAGALIDGYTQPGASPNTLATGSDAILLIELDGSAAGAGADGLCLNAGSNTVRGLVINGFDQFGIHASTSTGNVITGNYIGADPTGTVRKPNLLGIWVDSDAPGNRVGGTNPAERNLVSGNENSGMRFYSPGNVVEGNYVGVDASGLRGLGNGSGVGFALYGGNRLGGFTEAARNVIAANYMPGISANVGLESTGDVPNVIAGNYIGLAADGNTIPGIQLYGVYVSLTSRNTQILNNVVSGNGGFGIILDACAANTTIQGNYIGTDKTGMAACGNLGQGIFDFGTTGLVVGGPTARPGTGVGNVISGNTGSGLNLASRNAVVEGNVVGLGADGETMVGDQPIGVYFSGTDSRIGGTDPRSRNVISGNADRGLLFDNNSMPGFATRNTVVGNYIGTDVGGTRARGNGRGVVFQRGPSYNLVGGTAPGAGNLISGNVGNGIEFEDPETTANTVAGNLIGTDVTGAAALPNGQNGVSLSNAAGNTIGGGREPAGRNVIFGNREDGVRIAGREATGNVVQGNFIGTDASGLLALGNGRHGVSILQGSGNLVGSTSFERRQNVITGNAGDGIRLAGASGNLILNNSIGLNDADGPLGNGGAGVSIRDASRNNTVGEVGSGNFIFGNGGNGVEVIAATSTGNRIRANNVWSNGGLGIDLGADGVTPNDPAGGPRVGPNTLQNYPVLTSAVRSGTSLVVSFSFHSRPNASFSMDFHASTEADPSRFGEGEFYLGWLGVLTDGSGMASGAVLLPALLPAGVVSATATDSFGNSSEFSKVATVEDAGMGPWAGRGADEAGMPRASTAPAEPLDGKRRGAAPTPNAPAPALAGSPAKQVTAGKLAGTEVRTSPHRRSGVSVADDLLERVFAAEAEAPLW